MVGIVFSVKFPNKPQHATSPRSHTFRSKERTLKRLLFRALCRLSAPGIYSSSPRSEASSESSVTATWRLFKRIFQAFGEICSYGPLPVTSTNKTPFIECIIPLK